MPLPESVRLLLTWMPLQSECCKYWPVESYMNYIWGTDCDTVASRAMSSLPSGISLAINATAISEVASAPRETVCTCRSYLPNRFCRRCSNLDRSPVHACGKASCMFDPHFCSVGSDLFLHFHRLRTRQYWLPQSFYDVALETSAPLMMMSPQFLFQGERWPHIIFLLGKLVGNASRQDKA